MGNQWTEWLHQEWKKEYFLKLSEFLKNAYETKEIYPPKQPGVKIPPSLLNMYKELQTEYGYPIPNNGYLVPWAKQGVFLLNTVMTVEDSHPQSHAGMGWETFTDHVIQKINEKKEPVVFLLWGRAARNKACMIDKTKHLVLESAHPSPLSAYNGFFGCNHFKKANEFLEKNNRKGIDWQIKDI